MHHDILSVQFYFSFLKGPTVINPYEQHPTTASVNLLPSVGTFSRLVGFLADHILTSTVSKLSFHSDNQKSNYNF